MEAATHYAAEFERAEARRADGQPLWLAALQREALARFAKLGFPTPRQEAWKYTNLARYAQVPYRADKPNGAVISRSDIEERVSPAFVCNLFVVVDGRFAPQLSTPAAFAASTPRAHSLKERLQEASEAVQAQLARGAPWQEDAFTALNTAFWEDGAYLEIPRGTAVDAPIHLVFVQTPSGEPRITHPRLLLCAAPQSRALVIEDYVSLGSGPRFTNAVAEVFVGAGAQLDLVRLQREAEDVVHISRLAVQQESNSRFAGHSFSFGGELVRNDIALALSGTGAECTLNGLFVTAGQQHSDQQTEIRHVSPHCTSRELYKGILDGRSQGVFQGKIVVERDAQHSDALQQNKNLLLSDAATIDTKPQLEIYADDVQCRHGSTIGQLEEESLFYLRSRGIALEAARRLLTRAFAAEIFAAVPNEPLREGLGDLLDAHFPSGVYSEHAA